MPISTARRSCSPRPKARCRSAYRSMSATVGHTVVAGPTGAGKSVLLALMALQFRRYPRSQVFAFDFGGAVPPAPPPPGGGWRGPVGGGFSGVGPPPAAP